MTVPKINRCLSCRKIFSDESEFNKVRALVLTRDRIEGKYQIVISEEVQRSISELSQGMKETNIPYNEITEMTDWIV